MQNRFPLPNRYGIMKLQCLTRTYSRMKKKSREHEAPKRNSAAATARSLSGHAGMGLRRGGRRHGGHPLPGHIGRSWTALRDQIHHGCQPVRPVRTEPDARGHLCEGAARTVRKRVPGRLRRPGAGHAADVLLRLLSARRAGPGHEGAAHDGLRPVCDRQP